jgi:hypothetical protein
MIFFGLNGGSPEEEVRFGFGARLFARQEEEAAGPRAEVEAARSQAYGAGA